MASLNMNGSYILNEGEIDDKVSEISIGNYALGYSRNDSFIVNYVGRSDDNVNKRLKSWIGSKYEQFKFSYVNSPKAAFEKECHNYHDFGGKEKLDNEIHPQRPEDSNWECPVCTIFD